MGLGQSAPDPSPDQGPVTGGRGPSGRAAAQTRDDGGVLWPQRRAAPKLHLCPTETAPAPPADKAILIAISMTVGDRDLRFTTCHLCEAKWWFQEGELVPLTSVIDLVVKK